MLPFILGFFAFPVLCLMGAFAYMMAIYLRMKLLSSRCHKAQLAASERAKNAHSFDAIEDLMTESSIRVAKIQDAGIEAWPVMVDEMDLFSALQQKQNDLLRNN